jgi:hypothetical protein
MPNYTESEAYAQERYNRIHERFQYHYSRNYYIRRACDSATRRMTNITKLRVWALVLDNNGWTESAEYARERANGLVLGSITPRPRTPRLGRTEVPSYIPIEPLQPQRTGVSMVTYNFTVGEEA